MLKTLLNVGFSQQNAEVYAFLALNGVNKVSDIADALDTPCRKVRQILKKLQNQQIVFATSGRPIQFAAVPLDRVLDGLKRDSLEKVNDLERKKKKLFALWKKSVKG